MVTRQKQDLEGICQTLHKMPPQGILMTPNEEDLKGICQFIAREEARKEQDLKSVCHSATSLNCLQ